MMESHSPRASCKIELTVATTKPRWSLRTRHGASGSPERTRAPRTRMRQKVTVTSLSSKRWSRPIRDEITQSHDELHDAHAADRGSHQAALESLDATLREKITRSLGDLKDAPAAQGDGIQSSSMRWIRPFRDEITQPQGELQESHAAHRGDHQAALKSLDATLRGRLPDRTGIARTHMRHKVSATGLNSKTWSRPFRDEITKLVRWAESAKESCVQKNS